MSWIDGSLLDASRSSSLCVKKWLVSQGQLRNMTRLISLIAYRLYTVIPRLLLLIDELTNWYIRFNRARLKGEGGPEDTVSALNTLFETLLTLCKTMVSNIRQISE
jgi:isoleucyl-tRNA synthetase